LYFVTVLASNRFNSLSLLKVVLSLNIYYIVQAISSNWNRYLSMISGELAYKLTYEDFT